MNEECPPFAFNTFPPLPTNLERFQAKWKPVRVKKTRQVKNLEPRFDSIETEKAPGHEPINPEWSADGCFGAHTGLKSDIA